MKDETFHVISNTHWDREWYMSHEKFLVRLVELMDRLLDIMEKHTDYRFVTDGQLALVEDYITAKPENRPRVEKLVGEGRLLVGPWYTQPLENIVGGEALIRNLAKGISDSEKLGKAMRFSYEIDEFGHTSQFPQILAGFGIKDVMAWRGVPKGCRHLFNWQSPDGTAVSFFNSNAGYGEATSLPSEEENFTEIIDGIPFERDGLKNHVKSIRELRLGRSDSSHMLWLNGIDHSWAQEDILEVCKKVEKLFPEYKVVQSSLEEYADAVKKDLEEKGITPETYEGELMFTAEPVLESTNSLHPRQKRRHYESEKLLVRYVEPLCSVAALTGDKYPVWGIDRAWKYVLENHAHDSLGCCSVDEVFEQVMARYGASISVSEQLRENALRYIMSCGPQNPSVWIFNLASSAVSGSCFAEFDIPEGFGGKNIHLETADGTPVKAEIITVDELGDVRYNPRLGHPTWGNIARFRAIIDLPEIKAYSAVRLNIVRDEQKKSFRNRHGSYMVRGNSVIESRFFTLSFNRNGTFNLTDKRNSRTYNNQLQFTSDGESAHCYVHADPVNDRSVISSLGCESKFEVLFDSPIGCEVKVSTVMLIPAGITADRRRKLDEKKPVEIESVISVGYDSDFIGIEIKINNTCKNHRIRALFPSGFGEAMQSESGQAFDEVKRPITIPDDDELEEKPYTTHPMQDYCAVTGKDAGLAVSARGIYEYECIADGDRALALTLLRAIELIDNETFEITPEYFMHEAQNLCEVSQSLNLIPFESDRAIMLDTVKRSLLQPVFRANRQTEDSVMPGYVRPADIFADGFTALTLGSKNKNCEVTAFYKSSTDDSFILRVRNRGDEDTQARLNVTIPGVNIVRITETNLEGTEENGSVEDSCVSFGIGHNALTTFKLKADKPIR